MAIAAMFVVQSLLMLWLLERISEAGATGANFPRP